MGQLTSEQVKANGKQEHVFKGMLLRPETDWFTGTNEDNGDEKEHGGSKGGNPGNCDEKSDKLLSRNFVLGSITRTGILPGGGCLPQGDPRRDLEENSGGSPTDS